MSEATASQSGVWLIANEFAQVRLTIDRSGYDPRLVIEDLTTDRVIMLDAFMLAGLTTATAEAFDRHMDPNPRLPHVEDHTGGAG
jgi:hypothetical protein